MLLPIIVPIIAAFAGLLSAPDDPASPRLVPASGQSPDSPVPASTYPLDFTAGRQPGHRDTHPCDTSQKSGITGTVYSLSGNQMPAPSRKKSPGRGIRATVCIFQLTSESQVVHADPTHYRTILTPSSARSRRTKKDIFRCIYRRGLTLFSPKKASCSMLPKGTKRTI
ncbi:hypothetical protein ACQ86N_48335 [Puia sp. P3]|uniref:hypothetical protein n=1 Tax=Puia sp. P3 TaxID=3423952 RepID=UPI003D66E321